MVMRWRYAGALVAAATSACSLLVDTSGLSGGAADDSAADAGSDGPPAGTDAGGGADAGDAGSGDAAPAFVCAPGSGFTFCDDFDHDALASVWSSVTANTGQISVVQGGSVSPPNALLAANPAVSASGDAPYVEKDLSGPLSAITCRLAVRRDVVGDGLVSIVQISVGFGNSSGFDFAAQMTASKGGVELDHDLSDGGTSSATASAPLAFAVSTFHVLSLTVDGTSASLTVDGTMAAELPTGFGGKFDHATLYVGLYANEASSAWSARYDDVGCIVTP